MDSFDDFEMKPLSDGLGFHKKSISLKESTEQTGVAKSTTQKRVPNRPTDSFLNSNFRPESETTYEDLLASLSAPKKSDNNDEINRAFAKQENPIVQNRVSLSETLPRHEVNNINTNIFPETPRGPMAPEVPRTPRDEVDKENISISSDIFKNRVNDSVKRSAHDSPPVSNLKPAPICLRSMFLDVLVVLAISLIFLLSLLMVTKADLMNVWLSTTQDFMTQLSVAVLYVAVYQMYIIVSRSFFGRSLGEWTFDFQLGKDEDQKSAYYPIKVLWRSLLILLTGIVTIPLLSFIFRKDLAAKLSGLQLYERK